MDENITLIFLPQENHETLMHQAISNGTTGRIAVLIRRWINKNSIPFTATLN